MKRGFTLLEAMVSVGIISLIGVLIFGAFDGMNRSRKRMTNVMDRHQQGRNAIDRMSREIGSAFLSNHQTFGQQQFQRLTLFSGSDRGQTDRLDFTAFSHLRLGRDTHESDQTEISYFLSRNPDTDGLDLVRRSQKHIDDDPTRGGVVQVLAEHVTSFDVSYLDPLTGDWVNDWDSSQAAGQLNRLPSQVWIRLQLADLQRDAIVTFETKATIAMRAPIDFATR